MDANALLHKPGTYSPKAYDEPTSCCYGRCVKQEACEGKCSYWKPRTLPDKLILLFSILASLSVLVAIIGPIAIDALVDEGINATLIVDSKDASGYKGFQTNTRDGDQVVHYGVYYFDVQNPDGVINGDKPQLLERGPYMYREYFYKFDIEWTKGGEHVSFYEWKYYVFDPANSAPGVDPWADNITQAYFSVLTMEELLEPMEPMLEYVVNLKIDAYFAEKEAGATPVEKAKLEAEKAYIKQRLASYELWELLFKLFLCASPYGVSPFMTRPAHDVYWGWFNDPILSMFKPIAASAGVNLTASIPGIASNYTSMEDTVRRSNRDLVHTGKNDIRQLNQYILYQNASMIWVCLMSSGGSDEEELWPTCPHFQSDWNASQAMANGYVLPWENAWANRIQGTDGTVFGRPVTHNQLQSFISDIYSSRFLELHSTNDDFHGIPLNRYGLREQDLENATVVPANAQFYQFGPKGLSNFTSAVGLPLFASKPHFLDGDLRLQEAVIGLNPETLIHDTYLDIEENTGIAMRARKRLQANNVLFYTELPTLTQQDATLLKEILVKLICTKKNQTECPEAEALATCMSTTVTWNIRGGSLYLPYTWTDEYYDLKKSDAISVRDDVLGTQQFAHDLQFWGFITAGILALLALTVYMTRRVVLTEQGRGGNDYESGYQVPPENDPKIEQSTIF